MKGLELQSDKRFVQIFAPYMKEFSKLHWIIRTQSGPFDYMTGPDWNEIRAELGRYLKVVDQEQGEGLWRPGVFPRFAEMLVLGEWSYLIGLRGSRANAIQTTAEFAEATRSFGCCSSEFFAFIQKKAEILILQVAHGEWEIYVSDASFLERLRTKYTNKFGAHIVDSDKWQRQKGIHHGTQRSGRNPRR